MTWHAASGRWCGAASIAAAAAPGRSNVGARAAWCGNTWRSINRCNRGRASMPDRPRPASEAVDQLLLVPEVGQPRGGLPLPVSGETEPLVLSRGNVFCVTNRRGDIAPAGARDLGLFHEDTRHLSRYELWISGGPPVVLSADTAGAAGAQV